MKLVSVYRTKSAPKLLYELLKSRDESVNISHKTMPSYASHCRFIKKCPYPHWYLIEINGIFVGSIYLSYDNEIGIFLFPDEQKKGYGAKAVQALLKKCGSRRYFANIAPTNKASARMFKKLGFRLIQHTYEFCQ